MTVRYWLPLLAVWMSACGSGGSTTKPALKPQQFTYNGPGRCDTTTNRGVTVRVSYFLLDDNDGAARSINDTLRARVMAGVTGWLDSASVADAPATRTDLDAAAQTFATDYQTLTQDMGPVGGCWEIVVRGDTLYAGPRTLTVRLDTYAYTGGAHPNSYTSLLTFDRNTGKVLSLNDMVADTNVVLPLVERAFRRKQGIRPQRNLEDEGYFLNNGRFFLPENVGMARDGLLFYYNPYEIAAYALGPIEVTVPYNDLKDQLQQGLP